MKKSSGGGARRGWQEAEAGTTFVITAGWISQGTSLTIPPKTLWEAIKKNLSCGLPRVDLNRRSSRPLRSVHESVGVFILRNNLYVLFSDRLSNLFISMNARDKAEMGRA